MKNLRFLLAAIVSSFLILDSDKGIAQNYTFMEYDNTPGLIKFIRIIIADDVSGNCWTNVRAVESSTRLFFEREGIGVLKENPAFYSPAVIQLYIGVIGFRQTSGVCASTLSVQAGRPTSDIWGKNSENNEYSISVWSEMFQRRFIMTNGTNNDSQISANVDEVITTFMADILSSQRSDTVKSFFENFPRLKNAPLSEDEFNKLLSSSQSE